MLIENNYNYTLHIYIIIGGEIDKWIVPAGAGFEVLKQVLIEFMDETLSVAGAVHPYAILAYSHEL